MIDTKIIWKNVPYVIEEEEDGTGIGICYDHDGGIMVYTFENNKSVHLVVIDIPKKQHGKGKGTKLMKEYLDYCDRVNKPATLKPTPSKTHTVDNLVKFYNRFGFIMNTHKTMSRPCPV